MADLGSKYNDTIFHTKGYDLNGTFNVFLVQYKLHKLHVHGIAVYNDELLSNKSEYASLIEMKAGPGLVKECRSMVKTAGPKNLLEVTTTFAGNLPCKRVLHAICPFLDEDADLVDSEECARLMETAFDNLLAEAGEFQLESLALPLPHNYQHGQHAILTSLFKAVLKFESRTYLKQVFVVDEDTQGLLAFSALMAQEESRVDQGHVVYIEELDQDSVDADLRARMILPGIYDVQDSAEDNDDEDDDDYGDYLYPTEDMVLPPVPQRVSKRKKSVIKTIKSKLNLKRKLSKEKNVFTGIDQSRCKDIVELDEKGSVTSTPTSPTNPKSPTSPIIPSIPTSPKSLTSPKSPPPRYGPPPSLRSSGPKDWKAVAFNIRGVFDVDIELSSVTELQVTALINSTDRKLMHTLPTALLIDDAAGSRFRASCLEYIQENGCLDTHEVAATDAGKLSCDIVLNAVCEDDGVRLDPSAVVRHFYETYTNIFDVARAGEIDSIGIHPLGHDAGYSRDNVSVALFRALVDLSCTETSIKKVTIADASDVGLLTSISALFCQGSVRSTSGTDVLISPLDG